MKGIKKFLLPFQNVKFNIGLFAVLALSSVLGTLIPQLPESPEKVQQWTASQPALSLWLQRVHFFDIYHSWWFIGLLALMAFDVIVCKLIFGKFPGLKTFKAHERRAGFARSLPLQKQWDSSKTLSETAETVQRKLRERGYRVEQVEQPGGEILLLGARHRAQRFGSWVSHIAIVLVLLSNLLGALYGFREVLNIPEQGSVRMQHRPWTVTCDDFDVEWYENSNTPKTFASKLRLFDGPNLVKQERVVVNEPMVYRRTRFYQATYGANLKQAKVGVFLRNHPKQSPTVVLRLGEVVPVPGTDYSLQILQFVPDFVMGDDGQPTSRSAIDRNPALKILISKQGQAQRAVWIFEQFPGIHMPPISEDEEFILILADYRHSFFTGVQVTFDPGADLFWTACAILVISLMLLFYLHYRRVWVVLSSQEGACHLQLGGLSNKGKHFEQEWFELTRHLENENADQ